MGRSPRLGWGDFQLALILTVTALPVLILTFYLYQRSIVAEQRLIQLDTEIMARSLARRVQSFARNREVAMKLTAAFYEGSDVVDDDEFLTYCQQLQKDYPEFCCFLFLDAPEKVHQLYPKGDKVEAARQLRSAGLHETVRDVLSNGKLRVISRTALVCKRTGVSIFYPVRKNGKISGVVMGSIPIPDGMQKIFGDEVLKYWHFDIRDSKGVSMFASPNDGGDWVPHSFLGQDEQEESLEAIATFPFGEDSWQLVIWPKSTLQHVLHSESSEWTLICGGITTIVVICGVSALFWRQRALKKSLEETRHAHDVVKASERRFYEVMERVHLLGIVMDSDSRILFCNDRFLQICGYSREEVIGKEAIELLVPPQEKPAFRQLRRDVLAGRVQEITRQMNLMTRDGKVRQISWNHVISRDHLGNVERVTSLGDDITDRLAQEEAQRQTQKLESLGVLAGGIAHDFNNLLTTIIGHNDLAMRKAGPHSELKPHLENVSRTARRLADLTSQMLAYSGRGRFEVRQVNINKLVEEMADLLRISIPKRVEIRYDLQADLPLIEVDATQIEQVLLNLVTNASEAIQNRSGWIALHTCLRSFDEESLPKGLLGGQKLLPGSYLELSVQDNGCGMDGETTARIFDPFFTTKFTGRGLGLAVLQGIVRGHDGVVTVESRPGSGTTFHVYLPVHRADSTHRSSAESVSRWNDTDGDDTTDADERYEGSGAVLLIDDEESIRLLAADVLEGVGFKVYQAADGETGMTLYKKHQKEIAVVLLDLTMPGMGGEATYALLRAMDPKVQVVMTSGYSNMELEWQFQDKNLAGFVHKPFLPSELSAKIIQVAHRWQGQAVTRKS